MIPEEWPAGLLAFVRGAWGELRAVEPLGGLSGARVWRLDAERQSAVLKQCGAQEASFYQRAAPALRAAAIGVPELWWSGRDGAGDWLLIEHLPAAPPRAAWLANPAWMAALARLHRLPPGLFAELPAPYRPPAPAPLAAAAAELLTAERRRSFRQHMAAIAGATQGLPAVLISGDPNPANWGLRASGQAVLFDWERAGLGPAAFDLAITMPGLGDTAAAGQIARAYLAAQEGPAPDPAPAHALAADILRCKAWVVAEFMAGVVERGLELGPAYAELWRAVPDWVALIAPAG